MKTFVETVVGGAIGLIALYVVGKVAYQAGKEVARVECEFEALRDKIDGDASDETVLHGRNENGDEVTEKLETETPTQSAQKHPAKKPSKLAMAIGAMKLLRRKDSVIGDLVKHPEAHKIEAFVDGEDLRINVKKRPLLA